ncbi:MAG: GntR family transcriptional regulator [Janthinobacterium lividum]
MQASQTTTGTDETLWSQVVRIVQERVTSGSYPLHSFLPREIDLASELGVSRNTVREAFRRLADDGLLDRRKRVGTRVVSTGRRAKLQIDLNPELSLRALSDRSDLAVVRREQAALPAEMRDEFPSLGDEKWHRVDCVRVTDGERLPLSFTQIYLAPDLEDVSLSVGTRRGQQFRMIEQLRGERMARTRTRLFPTRIPADVAKLLNVESGELALRVLHAMTNEAGNCREIVTSTYPASRYSFELSFPLNP